MTTTMPHSELPTLDDDDELEEIEENEVMKDKEGVLVLHVDSSTKTEASTATEGSNAHNDEPERIQCEADNIILINEEGAQGDRNFEDSTMRVQTGRIRKFFGHLNVRRESRRAYSHQRLERRHTAPARTSITAPLRPDGCLKRTESKSHDFVTRRNSVSFDKIQIREHTVTVGDNPSVYAGPPIALDWEVQHETEAKVDEYEKLRGERRTKAEMRMPATVREDLLIDDWEFSYRQVREASMQAREGHKQRVDSCKYQFADGARLLLEQTAKACKKPLSRRSDTEKEIKMWTKTRRIDD